MVRRIESELIGLPGQAEIRDERDHHERVAQETHQHGGSAEPVEVLSLKDVDGSRHRERARRHGDPDEVEGDPQPPGIGVGEARAAAETEGEPRHQRHAAEGHERQKEPVERGQQLLAEGLELHVVAVTVGARDRVRALLEEGVDGAERRADRHDGGRHGPEGRRRELRKRFLPVRREPEFLERHRGEVQHGRAADLLLAVDVVDVLVRAVLDALVGEREHLLAGAVTQGVRGARLDARRGRDRLEEPFGLVGGGRLPVERDRHGLGCSIGAVRALFDLRGE